jgi:hypothetical protein
VRPDAFDKYVFESGPEGMIRAVSWAWQVGGLSFPAGPDYHIDPWLVVQCGALGAAGFAFEMRRPGGY